MPFLACLPLIEADLPAVLTLDQRCLGGLWTHSGYKKELDSDCSDLPILVSAPTAELIYQRLGQRQQPTHAHLFAASDPTTTAAPLEGITLLGTGCLWAILEEAHLTTLAIEPDFQGQKLGQLLLCQLLLCAYRRGLTRATLEVRVTNERALQLYQKFGFKEVGIRKRYYSDGENARILWCNGLQTATALSKIEAHQAAAITHLETQHDTFYIRRFA